VNGHLGSLFYFLLSCCLLLTDGVKIQISGKAKLGWAGLVLCLMEPLLFYAPPKSKEDSSRKAAIPLSTPSHQINEAAARPTWPGCFTTMSVMGSGDGRSWCLWHVSRRACGRIGGQSPTEMRQARQDKTWPKWA
jgi:hypothetical protein